MPLIDSFGREIRYLRVSVTDRCNFRCHYCRPSTQEALEEWGNILTLEEMARLVRLFSELGVSRIRLTGGEPLLRKNVMHLIRELGALPDLEEVSLSTNAFLLDKMAVPLKEAGVGRVNISLDSLDPATFKKITVNGDLSRVLAGIDAAVEAGMHPVKVNMVVMGGVNDHEIPAMVRYAREKGVVLRFIETMPVGVDGRGAMGQYVPTERIMEIIKGEFGGELEPGGKMKGNGPARYFRVRGLNQNIGVISAMSQHFCDDCNRVRLTSKGSLVLCLGRDNEVDLMTAMRAGVADEEMKAFIHQAILKKPRQHAFTSEADEDNVAHKMSALGG